jgi:hypothetical protein
MDFSAKFADLGQRSTDGLATVKTAAVEPRTRDDIGSTRDHIEDFTTAAEKARSFTDLYEAMVARHPDRVNRVL